ncbi:hypothetical protein L9F63_006128, partial [Diploptera punctata]
MNMDNQIEPLKIEKHLLNRKFPSYDRPVVIGCFSLDVHRNYCNDLSQMKYVRVNDRFLRDGETYKVRYDLDRGREHSIERDYVDEHLDNLLKWILENNKTKENHVVADVVCFRGSLAKLMCTVYENQEGWIFCATKFNGTLFLCQFETEEKIKQRENMSDKEKQFTFWGRKFERYMCSDRPGVRPNPSVIVNDSEELCVIFKTKLNNRRLLIGAEVDGVLNCSNEINSSGELAQCRLVELKTSRIMFSDKQYKSFERFKLIRWWSQSFLVGIEHLLCGFRNDKGTVCKLQHFNVLQIPNKAKDVWNPNICMNFCDEFLHYVESVVEQERPDTVWKFEWNPGDDCVRALKLEGPSQYSFLPQWFTE